MKISITAERALLQEAHLCKQLLESGMTALRSADANRPGTYYQSFFELSIAIERVGKMIAGLDYLAAEGAFPSDRYFRTLTKSKNGHHSLSALVGKVEEVNARRSLGVENLFGVGTPESLILEFLSNFANSERYYNLRALNRTDVIIADPVAAWAKLVKPLVPDKRWKLNKKDQRVLAVAEHLDSSNTTIVVLQDLETGEQATTLGDVALNSVIMDRVNREGVNLCIHIVRYLSAVISNLTYDLRRQGIQVLHLDEFFVIWLNSDSFLRRRKTYFA